jgi:hypothetical protein
MWVALSLRLCARGKEREQSHRGADRTHADRLDSDRVSSTGVIEGGADQPLVSARAFQFRVEQPAP